MKGLRNRTQEAELVVIHHELDAVDFQGLCILVPKQQKHSYSYIQPLVQSLSALQLPEMLSA